MRFKLLRSIVILALAAPPALAQSDAAQSDAVPPGTVQPIDTNRPRVMSPAPIPAGQAHWSIGLSVATFPRMLVEEEVNQSPLVDARAVVGLPWNLTATAQVSTNFYIANQLSIGLRYGAELGPVAVGLGDEMAYWLGAFALSGFDNHVSGWINYPYVAASVDAGDVLISARLELIYQLRFSQFAGDIEVSNNRDRLHGGSFGVYLEQPLWKNQHVMLGAKITSTDFFYQSWMAFNTLRRRQLYPELFFAFLIR